MLLQYNLVFLVYNYLLLNYSGPNNTSFFECDYSNPSQILIPRCVCLQKSPILDAYIYILHVHFHKFSNVSPLGFGNKAVDDHRKVKNIGLNDQND